jgi:hypothetical protein
MSKNRVISRRDFLKLKGLMLIWFYFLQTLGVNIFANELKDKTDYSILDKLLKLPFSNEVRKELELRVFLQRRYCYDGNGNLHSLNRFLKEITHYIVTNQDFKDFKLLNTINDSQIDYTYMLNCTAKHNQLKSLQYLQKKLIGLKDNNLLINALEYAINSQSYETTIHLMKQKLKLDDKTQDKLLGILRRDEYEIFYEKISNRKNQMLLPYKKPTVLNKRNVPKKDVKFTLNSDVYYKYEDELYAKVYNATAQLYMNYLIDDFTVEYQKEKIDVIVWNHEGIYPINFLLEYQNILQMNGFDTCQPDYKNIDKDTKRMWKFKQQDKFYKVLISNEILDYKLELYDVINIEIL